MAQEKSYFIMINKKGRSSGFHYSLNRREFCCWALKTKNWFLGDFLTVFPRKMILLHHLAAISKKFIYAQHIPFKIGVTLISPNKEEKNKDLPVLS